MTAEPGDFGYELDLAAATVDIDRLWRNVQELVYEYRDAVRDSTNLNLTPNVTNETLEKLVHTAFDPGGAVYASYSTDIDEQAREITSLAVLLAAIRNILMRTVTYRQLLVTIATDADVIAEATRSLDNIEAQTPLARADVFDRAHEAEIDAPSSSGEETTHDA